MIKLHCQVIVGEPQPSGPSGPEKFRISKTNPFDHGQTIEVVVLTKSELICAIANLTEALAETI